MIWIYGSTIVAALFLIAVSFFSRRAVRRDYESLRDEMRRTADLLAVARSRIKGV